MIRAPKKTQIDGVGLERFPDDCDYFRVKFEIFAQIDQSIHFFSRDISLTGRTTSQTRSARAVTCTLRRTCLLQSEPKEIHFLDGNESFRYAMTKNGQNKHMIDQLMCKVRLKCVCICLLMIFNAWLKARLMKPCPRSIYSDVSQFRSRLLEKKSQTDCRERSQNDQKKLPHSQDRW